MTFGSLFSGVGGIDLGLERAGFQCRWQVENEPYCVKVLKKHWPEVKRYGDIREVTGDELEPVDLLAGGFPCQDLSQAGKRAGIEGTRSGLWFEFARIIGVVRPRYVLIENVPGLLVPGAMRRVVGVLAGLGYVGCWRSLRASEFGASHLRKRVFIIAWNRDGRREMAQSGCEYGKRRKSAYDSGDIQRDVSRESDEGCGREVQVAYGEAGGRGVLREPSGGDGLADRSDQELAHAERARSDGTERQGIRTDGPPLLPARSVLNGGPLADAGNGQLPIQGRGPQGRDGIGSTGQESLDDTQCKGLEVRDGEREQQLRQDAESLTPGVPPFAPGPNDPRWPFILTQRPDLAPALPQIRGVADGVPDWMDRAMSNRTKRLGRLGNAVVPDCAEWVGRRILEFENSYASL